MVVCDLLCAVNDLRAIPYVSMCVSTSSVHWACRSCNVKGIHLEALGTQIYIGAVRWLKKMPQDRVSRRLIAEWNKVMYICFRLHLYML